ncbi:hypothetical protein COMA1_30174 [Candidatus Nitrospira nitrosa]|uniref:Uncharacterized protein n=1 Tax=Candidatus Nitrospira nitrosa TaxID=1742972 RepID=A0A0S4LGF2_9BACT|nr:hypothetical protein COMA1_30174 [Candidatus Nitrospira nitrosa]
MCVLKASQYPKPRAEQFINAFISNFRVKEE